MSNVGKWDSWYRGLIEPQPYGDTITYQLGAEYLVDCDVIEDWGCGKGWFSKFVPTEKYRGVDGSHSPWAQTTVDLVSYKSHVSGIYMRHVLEHNYEWKVILENALKSFTDRMVLIIFTPLSETTKEIAFSTNPGVPDISFSLEDLADIFLDHKIKYRFECLETATQYGVETIFYLSKEN